MGYTKIDKTILYEGDFTTEVKDNPLGYTVCSSNTVRVVDGTYGAFHVPHLYCELDGKELHLADDFGSSYAYFGNRYLMRPDTEADTGEDYCISYYTTDVINELVLYTREPGTYHISFYNKEQLIHHIPDEYINVTWKTLGSKFDKSDMTTVVEETTITIDTDNSYVENPFALELIKGTPYTVTWDGVPYEMVAQEFYEGEAHIGNVAILAGSGYVDTGEPFFINWSSYNEILFVAAKEAGTHTISVQTPSEIITLVPEKYLPESAKNVAVAYSSSIYYNFWELDNTKGLTEEELYQAITDGKTAMVHIDNDTFKTTLVCTGKSGAQVNEKDVYMFAGFVVGDGSSAPSVRIGRLYYDGSKYRLEKVSEYAWPTT